MFSDVASNMQMRWIEDDGRVTTFRNPSNYSNGNTFDYQGRQLSCEHGGRRVVRYEPDGSVTVLADRFEGKRFNSPNDVVVHPDGSVWFTDPPWGIVGNYEGDQADEAIARYVFRIDPVSGAGVPVIHVWYIVEKGAPGLKQNAPLFQGVKEADALVRGSWGAAPVDGLEPKEGDHVVEKMRMNGFYETRLDILLRGLGVEQLVVTGAWTNMSIEHTARHGADAGYEVVVASDGTSTTDEDWQRAALEYAMTNVARVATCAEIGRALG